MAFQGEISQAEMNINRLYSAQWNDLPSGAAMFVRVCVSKECVLFESVSRGAPKNIAL